MTDSTTTSSPADAVRVSLEGTLWRNMQGTWPRVVEHLALRFARVRELAVEPLAGMELAAQVAALEAWAGDSIDWQREATRWLDENLAMHVKPDRATNQVVRAIAHRADIDVVTALPLPLAEAVLRHVGVLRSVHRIDVRTADQPAGDHVTDLAAVLADLPG